MTKSNNQNDAGEYQQEMAEMRARMEKMQKQLDKMSAEQDHKKPKTHLAALPKKSAPEIKSSAEKVLAAANAKQEKVLAKTDKTNTSAVNHAANIQKAPKHLANKQHKEIQAKASSAIRKQEPKKPLDHSSAKGTPTKSDQRSSSKMTKSAVPSSKAKTDTARSTTVKSNKHQAVGKGVKKTKQASHPKKAQPTNKVTKKDQPIKQSDTKPLSSKDQGQQIQQMGQDINKLLASVGMDSNDAKDLAQTYFYFISLIDNGKLVDQGRIITFNTKKMNHNGVVQGTNGEYYLDLEYLSQPHPKADALPMPNGYAVNLAEAKTLPDVETKDPSVTDSMDSKINLGGSTTVAMPESSKNSGYYLPLSKLNGAKIPVHKVQENQSDESPHQAFVSDQPSRTANLRHSTSNADEDIKFGPANHGQSVSASQKQAGEGYHEHSRSELRRERNRDKQNNRVGLGKALGTMFGFNLRK